MSTQIFNISLQNIKLYFEKMEKEAGWDISKEMYWGYYFLDHKLKKIESFSNTLSDKGFRIVEIRNIGDDNMLMLHAEEYVVHSPKTLFEQCSKLANLAVENAIEIFDGWDVEKEQMNKGLVD